MFGLPFLIILTVVFSIVQISIWSMFPAKLRDIIMSNPVLAFLVNLGGSNLILAFTGTASMVGACNMIASVIFGAYAMSYKYYKGITGLKLEWKKLLRIIPIIPTITVEYADRDPNIKINQRTA